MPNTATLYDLTDELKALTDALIDAGGEITDDMEERFDALLDMEEEKTEGYIQVIRDLEASAEAVKAEEDRLKKRRRALQNSADKLKDRLAWAMEQRDQEVRETDLGKVRLQEASRRSMNVQVDAEALPDRFKRVNVKPDKRELRDALKDGDAVAENVAELEEPSKYIRIY